MELHSSVPKGCHVLPNQCVYAVHWWRGWVRINARTTWRWYNIKKICHPANLHTVACECNSVQNASNCNYTINWANYSKSAHQPLIAIRKWQKLTKSDCMAIVKVMMAKAIQSSCHQMQHQIHQLQFQNFHIPLLNSHLRQCQFLA